MDVPLPEYDSEQLFERAEQFVRQCYEELDREEAIESRLAEIEEEIAERGHYEHTYEELEHGARMAWRNSNRCIGRFFWETLDVRDCRGVDTAEGVHQALCEHVEYAFNGGNIRPTISIFKPMVRGQRRVRIWNHQLIRYAGYETDDGVKGDPDSVAVTEYCRSRGWEGDRTDYDVLPHIVQIEDRQPELFDVPDDIVHEVEIRHPEYHWFEELDLRWYAFPTVSDMRLELGGLQYTAAPFNAWYRSTEIAARNLVDEDRYDVLPAVAERMGLDTSNNRSLWKDEALVEMNRAVLHSYEQAGIEMVDHHTVDEQFAEFERREEEAGREVTGDWQWLIPPMSPATTHVFHNSYDNTIRTPGYFYQDPPFDE